MARKIVFETQLLSTSVRVFAPIEPSQGHCQLTYEIWRFTKPYGWEKIGHAGKNRTSFRPGKSVPIKLPRKRQFPYEKHCIVAGSSFWPKKTQLSQLLVLAVKLCHRECESHEFLTPAEKSAVTATERKFPNIARVSSGLHHKLTRTFAHKFGQLDRRPCIFARHVASA
jgi:hypothetical protein